MNSKDRENVTRRIDELNGGYPTVSSPNLLSAEEFAVIDAERRLYKLDGHVVCTARHAHAGREHEAEA